MENKKKCAVCYTDVDGENSAILAMGGFGNPRYLCPECEELIDKVSRAGSYDEFAEGKEKLASRCHQFISDDTVTFEAVCAILDSSSERAEAIKNGTYDFALDEKNEEDEDGFDDIPEELKETEEDRLLDERDAEMGAKLDKILNWAMLAAFIGVVGFFVYFFFFR